MYALVITFRLQSSAKNRHEILALKSWDEVWDEHLYFAAFLQYWHVVFVFVTGLGELLFIAAGRFLFLALFSVLAIGL